MPSLLTSVIGGIQGSSASHNAANSLSAGYNTAGQTVTQAAAGVNPGIAAAGTAAGAGVTGAAGTAAAGANQAAAAAQQGVSPYTSTGAQAANQLATGLAPGGALNKPFDASMMEQNDPGYQFQLQQGQQAMQRQAAAGGSLNAGGTDKAIEQYSQGTAASDYNNAFNQYQTQQQNTFNRLATTAGMGQQGAEFAGTTGVGASEYGGTLNTGAQQFAGTANMNSTDLAASNTMGAANYLGNTQIGAGQAQAQGDLNSASAWNGMLGGIGSTANALAFTAGG